MGQSPLARYLAKVGILPQVDTGIDADSPRLEQEGDERYAYGRQLGKGGCGRVVLATDRNLRRSLAIKTLLEKRAEHPQWIQAFLEEAIVTAGLDHPNIVSIYDLSWSPKLGLYYTMKRLSGTPLHKVLRRLRAGDPDARAKFGQVRLLGYFREICMGISYAHARGVLHSDLKPDNIVIGEFGEVVIVDWGLAQLLGEQGKAQARAQMRAGTPEYMPPEQILNSGAALRKTADIWSLGVMLYELLTFVLPFEGRNVAETLQSVTSHELELPSVRAPEHDISPQLDAIVARALERDPEARYTEVEAMARDLDTYLEGARERQRRDERSRATREKIDSELAAIAEVELQIDTLLGQRHLDEHQAHQLVNLRRELIEVYEEVASTLTRSFEAGCEQHALRNAAGDLYWRVFSRLYPSHLRPGQQIRERSQRMLAGLSRNSMRTIIRVGRQRVGATSAEIGTTGDTPWLAIAERLADRSDGPDDVRSEIARVVERIGFLKNVPLFAHMDVWKLMSVSDACDFSNFEAGTPIFSQGEVGTALYILLTGYVDIVRDGAVINTLGPGDSFGEIAVLGEMPRTASAITVGEVTALALSAKRFRGAVIESGELALSVIQVLNERLRVATERESALRKLAQTLLRPTHEPIL